MSAFLRRFQAQLESIHGLNLGARVEDYLVGREAYLALGKEARAPEELLVLEEEQGLSLGLYIDPAVLERLAQRHHPLELLLGRSLPHYCVAAEGVSHWIYLWHRATRDQPVSQLELEVQAEVDKFASCALGLWQLGVLRLVRRLRERLYDGVRYFAHLDAEERERYSLANRLARGYARFLERKYLLERDLEGLLRELRQSFRLSGGEKYAYLAACGA